MCWLALNSDPFNLGQVDGVARAVVELRRPGGLMGSDGLGRLQVSAFVEINRDPRSTKRVRGYLRADAGARGTSLDHTEHVVAVHPIGCEVAGTINRPEEGRLLGGQTLRDE